MGDGNSYSTINPAHSYGFNGVYSINALATDTITGCFDTIIKTDYINCSGGGANPCTIVATISPSGQAVICNNDSILLTASYYPGAIYTWIRSGIVISGATDSVLYAMEAGMYQVMITDTVCTVFSSYFNLINYPAVSPVITSEGSIMPCTNDSMELIASSNFVSYEWSTGATTSNIFVNTSGYYVVSATDANNCVNASLPFVVNASLLDVPDICIVGIDSATNRNRVIWQRENNALIDSFRIYRETHIANQYQLIATKAFNEQSLFIDNNSIPAQQAYRYKVSAIDTCGAETPLSSFHKTNHLTINAGLNNTWNLIWDGYEGFNFGTYNIYRGTDSTQMILLTQIQSTLTSFSDLNPPTGDVFYQIEVVSLNDCYPDSIFSKANTNYNTSRSNTANTNMAPNTGIIVNVESQMKFNLYPNPNKGQFTLDISSPDLQNMEMNIFNSLGSHILNEKFEVIGKYSHKVNLQTLSKGMYFIRLNTVDEVVYYGKFIIN